VFTVINKQDAQVVECKSSELYQHRVYIGKNDIETNARSSYWYVDKDRVVCETGTGSVIKSKSMCVEIFGYTPETRMSTFNRGTDLPYVNGCSTKQLIPAARPGDPTFQYLYIPAGTSEQVHHIHATPRIVYVARGCGKSIVGTPGKNAEYELKEGDVIILGKMIPHHFETSDQDLIVLPLHVFSSVGQQDFDHPMFNGTHKV
jgi:mannose-6-phosphate isomerase-like protein (cupin superfamily)